MFGSTPVLFADFLRPGAEERAYEEVKDYDRLLKLLNDYLEEYNESHHAQVNPLSLSICVSLSFLPSLCFPHTHAL